MFDNVWAFETTSYFKLFQGSNSSHKIWSGLNGSGSCDFDHVGIHLWCEPSKP